MNESQVISGLAEMPSAVNIQVWAPVLECIGLDLGDKESSWCRVGADNKVAGRGRVKTTRTALQHFFGALSPIRVVLENGTHVRWVAKLIASCGHEVIVGDPRQLRYISHSSNKHDEADAEKLARLGRVDPHLLHPIQLRTDEQQADLSVIRVRRQLVETRVRLAHQARGIAKSTGTRLPAGRSQNWDAWAERMLTAIVELRLPALHPLLKVIEELNRQIATCDERVESLARNKYPETRPLTSAYAVGDLTALTFVLTLGNAERFASSRDVGPYLGLRPRRDASGESNPQLGISKQGDAYLRTLLVQCAQHYLMKRGPDSELRRWGLRLCARGGKNAKKRAMVAVARKLAVILHRLWVSGETYRPFSVRTDTMLTAV